jgi:hypothetical protein
MNKKLSLESRLSIAFFAIGLVPAFILAAVNISTLNDLADSKGQELVSQTMTVGELINRNLFERYGDVQAFGYNQAIFDKSSWYQTNSSTNKIASVMNEYIRSYGVYSLSILVDLEGKVIAVNDKDLNGKSLRTEDLYSKNFKEAPWFQDSIKNNFYTQEGFISGTVIEDAYFDPIIKRLYNNDGLTIGFSAPVKDESGTVIGVWKNFTNFSVIEEIVWTSQESLKNYGYPKTEYIVTSKNGTVLVRSNHKGEAKKDYSRYEYIGSENLIKDNYRSILTAMENKVGFGEEVDPKTDEAHLYAYSQLAPALGFKGMPWITFIRAKKSEVLSDLNSTKMIIVGLLLLTICSLLWFTKSISKRLVSPLRNILGQFNGASKLLDASSGQILTLSQDLASGSTEQAAAIQESVASMTEMSGMISQTTDLTQKSRVASSTMASDAQHGAGTMQSMVSAMEAIKSANSQLQNMVDVIAQISSKTAVINDIVFKTQLLSFNASIEAARAGQHGRGFAVVAEEVGHLAELSGNAAKEIESLIEQSKKEVSQIVDLTQARVLEGHRVSNDSLVIFNKLNSVIAEVDRQIEGITQATKEQNLGIKQSSIALTEMDNVAQRTRDLAQEASAYSMQLSEENSKLKHILGSFSGLLNGSGRLQETRIISNTSINTGSKKSKRSWRGFSDRNRTTNHSQVFMQSTRMDPSPSTTIITNQANIIEAASPMPTGEASDIASRLIKKKAENRNNAEENDTEKHSPEHFTPMT